MTTSIARTPCAAERRVPGEMGAWIFILGDMSLFALLFVAYLVERAKNPALFDSQQALLDQNLGAVNTLLLLCSSLFVVTAIRALRSEERRKPAPPLIVAAFVVGGCGFTFVKYLEWSDKIGHGLVPSTNNFWMYYYILTGVHFLHLLLGTAVLVALYFQSRRPSLSRQRFALVEGGGLLWHMIDLLWIVLFPLLYLVR